MSKTTKGMYGNSHGKLGNLIISSWKGIEYVRVKPDRVRNPKTPGQLAQRRKFMLINSIISPLAPFIRIGFSGYAERMSAYNAALSYNLKNAIMGSPTDPVLDFEKLIFSRGIYPGVAHAGCIQTGPYSFKLYWSPAPMPAGARYNDRITVILYNETQGKPFYFPDLATRAEGLAMTDLPQADKGDIIHCYLSVINNAKALSGFAKKGISESCYAGKLTVI